MSIAVVAPPPFMANDNSVQHVNQWDQSGHSSHRYPHSHHGTPAQEYPGFFFNVPPPTVDAAPAFVAHPQARQFHHQLQPLVMPQWPSMLSAHQQPIPQHYASVYHGPVVHGMAPVMHSIPTPVSATSSKPGSNPRRTLTDSDRKDMCMYAESNPDKKQTEIGAVFGVERSTVSKVLRHREKYLFQDDGSRSPIKRLKGRSPDMERTLANWARKMQREGVTLSNDMIRERIRAFNKTLANGSDTHQPVTSNRWIEKFKLENDLNGAKSRKSSLSQEDAENPSIVRTPAGVSPRSISDLSPPALQSSTSMESLTDASVDDNYVDLASIPLHSQSMSALHAAYIAGTVPGAFSSVSPASSFLSPDAGTTHTPFAPRLHPSSLHVAEIDDDCNQRPRRQTFPTIEPISSHHSTAKYNMDSLSSPMPDHSSQSMNPAVALTSISPNHAYQHGPTHDRPRSITPTNAMAPPPLPMPFGVTMAPSGVDLVSELAPTQCLDQSFLNSLPTTEDARRAVQTLSLYAQSQDNVFLNPEDSIYLGRLMERVQRQACTGTAM